MLKRLEFHKKLCQAPGVKKVYFQPPSNTRMSYPCIRYNAEGGFSLPADDLRYLKSDRYTVIAIDPNPDSYIPNYILDTFRFAKMDRTYTADNLNHFVFTIYI